MFHSGAKDGAPATPNHTPVKNLDQAWLVSRGAAKTSASIGRPATIARAPDIGALANARRLRGTKIDPFTNSQSQSCVRYGSNSHASGTAAAAVAIPNRVNTEASFDDGALDSAR